MFPHNCPFCMRKAFYPVGDFQSTKIGLCTNGRCNALSGWVEEGDLGQTLNRDFKSFNVSKRLFKVGIIGKKDCFISGTITTPKSAESK